MTIEVRPVTVFEDVETMVGPKRPDAKVDTTMAYFGTRELFEQAGFRKADWCLRVVTDGP